MKEAKKIHVQQKMEDTENECKINFNKTTHFLITIIAKGRKQHRGLIGTGAKILMMLSLNVYQEIAITKARERVTTANGTTIKTKGRK